MLSADLAKMIAARRAGAVFLSRVHSLHGVSHPPSRYFVGASLCEDTLRPFEEGIAKGLRKRLAGTVGDKANCVVAVAGSQSLEFAAAVRAVRATGAIAAPLDVRGKSTQDVAACLAEAQASFAIAAGIRSTNEALAVREASHGIGAEVTTATHLNNLGCSESSSGKVALGSQGPPDQPFLFFSRSSGGAVGHNVVRVAEVHNTAMSARVKNAVASWNFTAEDRVLCLALRSDDPAALVDGMEAPLSAGATVRFSHARPGKPENQVWDLWSSVREEADATIIFVDANWCWSLLDAYDSLAAPIRSELANRWARKPFRHAVAVASQNKVLSQELARRWADVFKCPLTWLFSSAEAGSLYTATAQQDPRSSFVSTETNGLDWKLDPRGELLVRGDQVFAGYRGRPRSSAEAFDDVRSQEDAALGSPGSFCRTGHIVSLDCVTGSLLPAPAKYDLGLEIAVDRYLKKGPGMVRRKMAADWKVKKVPIRVYYHWRSKKGFKVLTKKHNNVPMVYTGKYK